MFCQHCNKLSNTVEIRGPRLRRELISMAASGMANGVLVNVSQRYPHASQPFQDVAAGGPWDDHVNYHFECRYCGTVFRLEAETYHGSGGTWGALPAAAL